MQGVGPGVLRVLEHQVRLLRDIPIAFDTLFAPIDRYFHLGDPVIPVERGGEVRQWQRREVCLPRGAKPVGRDDAGRGESPSRRGIHRNGPARWGGEIPVAFCRRGDAVMLHPSTTLAVPFLRPEKEYLVFFDGSAD